MNPTQLVTTSLLKNTSASAAAGPLTPLPLLSLLNSLISHNKFDDAKSVLRYQILSEHPHRHLLHPAPPFLPPSRALLNTCIFSYCRSGWPHLAAQIFKSMRRHKLRPNLLTLNTLLGSLVKNDPSSRSIDFCNELFNDAVELGLTPGVVTFNILISGYCLEYKFRDAMELLRNMEDHFKCKPDNVSYNTILDALRKKGRLHDIRDLLLDMKGKGLFPNRNTYNILVDGYCKVGLLKDAAKVMELMTQDNLLPDLWTYNSLMNGMCNAGKIDEALKLRDEMEGLKLFPDVITYNTLINGCFEAKKSSMAGELLGEMREEGVKLNEVTHNIMIKWYCKDGKMKEASDMLSKMKENGFSPDWVTYNTLISGFCKTGHLAEAFNTMNEMGGKGLKMDTVTLNTALHNLCRERMVKDAYDLLCSANKRGYIVDEMSYGTLIVGYFKEENADRAMELWDEMKGKDVIPSTITYNSVIGGLCKLGKTDIAITKLNDLLENGLVPDETTYNTIIHGYCWERKVEKAFQFHNKMVEKSFKPDIYTCNILLRGLCMEGMIEKAMKLFDTWISKEKNLDAVSYNTLIGVLCKEGRLEDALGLIYEMEQKKLGPDSYTFNAIIGALKDGGISKEAEEILSRALESKNIITQDLKKSDDEKRDAVVGEGSGESDLCSLAYSEQIKELCVKGRYKDAMCIFLEQTQQGITVNKSTYITLMNGLIKRRKSIMKRVLDEKQTTVYKRAVDKTYQLKVKASRFIFSEISQNFPLMPFTARALEEKRARLGIVECVRNELLQPYPVLHEKPDDLVAHIKFAVLLTANGSDRITSHPLQRLQPTKSVEEDPEIKAWLALGTKSKKKGGGKKKKGKKADRSEDATEPRTSALGTAAPFHECVV